MIRSLAPGVRSARGLRDLLSIAPGTAQRHVANILRKLGVSRRAEAVRVAVERGLLA